MAFRRKARDEAAEAPASSPDALEAEDQGAAEVAPVTSGPWDVTNVPDGGPARLDLGGLLIPMQSHTEVRVEVNDAQQVVAATVTTGQSTLQLLAFAAPRTMGIWDDVRHEIAESVRAEGGTVEEVEGALGTELHTRAKVAGKDGSTSAQRLRFVGADGPRWFLRGVFAGPAATGAGQAAALENTFRNVVVVRGEDAMAPREALALRLPQAAAQAMSQAEESGEPVLDPFERGPEITEIY